MNKTTLILTSLFLSVFYLSAQSAKQGFDNKAEDNWAYTSNILFYSQSNNTDIWGRRSNANGRIPGPFSGSDFLAGRDLDNAYSEQVLQTDTPEHILTFETLNIGGVQANLSFRVQYIGLDKGDYIKFQLRYDNATDWNTADYSYDVFKTSQNGNFNSVGWDEVAYSIPSGHNFVRMRLIVYQNGNEYLGFDNFELQTATLSNKNNLIEGFSFGPNPTRGSINFKANVVLDKISFYNVLGKEVMTKRVNTKEVSMNLSNLSSGIYLAKVQSGSITQTLKIIKK
ncbi:T9SS type A sorting domain-containing protein [uncultured Algibacter sp.]|uniref:T9SS type A sorting domain-containing protein n=1 Tax=uncultured Algibacter sp. TaxID=298659 RepID=UPI002631D148|nr:T9SS type A sorting domain-containing protein [uncultured Algibacter sp.]